ATEVPDRLRAPVGAIGDAVVTLLRRLRERPEWRPREPGEAGAATLAALDAMVTRFRAGGVDPVLVYHPSLPERQGEARPEREAFRNWAGLHRVEFLDLGAVEMGPEAYRDALHPTAAGAEAIAAALRPVLDVCG
ncbi:hypothetical protein HKCCE2091_21905, partial [Rhodobacterales bacterium HKCCE2091]|nr:hypothetical protein [Rhodobacterales bacterium HKCCE2091]